MRSAFSRTTSLGVATNICRTPLSDKNPPVSSRLPWDWENDLSHGVFSRLGPLVYNNHIHTRMPLATLKVSQGGEMDETLTANYFSGGRLWTVHVHFFTLIHLENMNMNTHTHTHTRLETVSVLLVWVPSSVPVCLLGFWFWALLSSHLWLFAVWAVVMSLGWVPVNGSFAVAVFVFVFFFLSWSLYLCCFLRVGGRGWLARALGSLLLARYRRSVAFGCLCLLVYRLGGGAYMFVLCLASYLKEYTRFFFRGGGGSLDEMFLCQRMRALSRHQIHPRDLGGP